MLGVLVLFVCFFAISLSWVYFIKDRKRVNIPGPYPLPVVGNGHQLAVSPPRFLKLLSEYIETYGNTFLVYILSERFVLVSDPCVAEAITSSIDYITKGVSYRYLHPWLGQGLLTATGNRWKAHRKFLTPAFHFNILQNFLPVFCKTGKVLTEKLTNLADGKLDIDLFPIIALAALDNVTESIMGVSMNAQKDSRSEYVQAIEKLSNVISTRMRNPVVGSDFFFNLLPHKQIQDKALKVLQGQTKKVIDARRDELNRSNITSLGLNSEFGIKNKHAFLDLLLLAEIDGNKIDDEKVREEVDTFMFEGHDTTTSGIVFALYCLSKNPEIQEKILEEQMSIFGDDMDRDPTYNELRLMKYLELVIKESLRLYPSVPFIQRQIIKDSHIEDKFLPEGTSVIIDIFHMQRRADIYEKPLEFRPDRFLNMESKDSFSWLPFSAGPRNCIGQKFAMMELKVTLAEIVKKFNILPSALEPELCGDLILRSTNGVHVKLLPRH